jgi:UDP-N-acetylglucosamine 2-epimerase (non-hydrolysing)
MKKVVVSIIGARPNIIKMVPVYSELTKYKEIIKHIVIHTGQHFDDNLSKIFFNNFGIKQPDINLNIGSNINSLHTGNIMIALEKEVSKLQPDIVLLYGDVNSTLAGALVSSKIILNNGKKPVICHIESGLRSFDNAMPEEINRKITDILSDHLFVTEKSGVVNLLNQGIPKSKIHFVGNTMIDSLVKMKKYYNKSQILKELCISENHYALVTLHRPSNVDSEDNFIKIIELLDALSKKYSDFSFIFPIHPRTKKMLKFHNLENKFYNISNLIITDPLGYIDFIKLISSAMFVLTDSGGIQEETTFLKIPCITLRKNTERPVTVEEGSNTICGLNESSIFGNIKSVFSGKYKKSTIPRYWDGNASVRIVKILKKL